MLWGVMILLFLLSVFFRKQKVTTMILRLFYLIMLGTGLGMLFMIGFPPPLVLVVKAILAILLFGIMEMILGRTNRRQPKWMFWILFIILVALVPMMGYGIITF
jgi:hypothetical protein